jgi:hypothetical protein
LCEYLFLCNPAVKTSPVTPLRTRTPGLHAIVQTLKRAKYARANLGWERSPVCMLVIAVLRNLPSDCGTSFSFLVDAMPEVGEFLGRSTMPDLLYSLPYGCSPVLTMKRPEDAQNTFTTI